MRQTVIVVCAGLAFALAYIFLSPTLREEAAFRFNPSAERALALAQKHFDSKRADLYDVDKAEEYLEEAYKLDPTYLAVNHELARIAFLKGHFGTALEHIDKEIGMHGESLPNSYYIRGLIQGYRGEYHEAALDYAVYLKHDPTNWAAINDYAWVLLKAGRTEDALLAVRTGLAYFPDNPWLLNSESIALYELKQYEESIFSALKASSAAENISAEDWLRAYPGNDPRIAEAGVASLRSAISDNMHIAALTVSNGAVQ